MSARGLDRAQRNTRQYPVTMRPLLSLNNQNRTRRRAVPGCRDRTRRVQAEIDSWGRGTTDVIVGRGTLR